METLSALAPLILGPYGAIVVLVIVLYYIYSFLNTHIIPMLKDYFISLQKHNDNVDSNMKAIIKEHEKDRRTFEKSIESLVSRLDRIEEDMTAIKQKLKE